MTRDDSLLIEMMKYAKEHERFSVCLFDISLFFSTPDLRKIAPFIKGIFSTSVSIHDRYNLV